ncbi:hypothetical protein U1708_15895 [Sphingomonas sp. ZB1N12]|uniref:hypothetical protein n=1 Tax=Sphingomonas arabinosi TaxID=3096160 RepID=UPI002FCBF03F
MDYASERDPLPTSIGAVDIAHGIIQSAYKGKANTVTGAIARRAMLHGADQVNAHNLELLLPPSAPDLLTNLATLVPSYEGQLIPGQVDLLGVTTLRFDYAMPCHRQWELARGWAALYFAERRNLVVQLIHHVPGLAGRTNKPHIHCLWMVRALHGCVFGAFADIAKPGSKTLLATEWAAYLGSRGR